MNTNKRNCLCAAIRNDASNLIAYSSLLRHHESQDWAKMLLIGKLREIVAAAAFFGVTTKDVKYEMKKFVEWFNESKGRAND